MSNKLSDRIQSYQSATDYKLLSRVPVIICVNGRGFAKATQLLDKPYCAKFAKLMSMTMLKLCSNIEGAFFAYHHNDEIIIVSHNDQSNDSVPWFDNRIQKICSVSASIATLYFNQQLNNEDINMTGEIVFASQVFVVPTIMEAINTIIYKQQQNFYQSIQSACFYNLLNSYNTDNIRSMLNGLSIDEKIELLYKECNIDFNKYPLAFRRGVACYKVPKIINDVAKNKWTINAELPIFAQDQSMISNIFKTGYDLFRAE
jgi:tRNA(His) 5'-end guanylyltransferase